MSFFPSVLPRTAPTVAAPAPVPSATYYTQVQAPSTMPTYQDSQAGSDSPAEALGSWPTFMEILIVILLLILVLR